MIVTVVVLSGLLLVTLLALLLQIWSFNLLKEGHEDQLREYRRVLELVRKLEKERESDAKASRLYKAGFVYLMVGSQFKGIVLSDLDIECYASTAEIVCKDVGNSNKRINLKYKQKSEYTAHELVIEKLLKQESDQREQEEANTALLDAVKKGELSKIEACLLLGADVNAKDKDGKTALHCAELSGCAGAVEYLKSKGAK